MITFRRLRKILSYNPKTGIFTWAIRMGQRGKIGAIAGSLHPKGYILIKIEGKSYNAARLAWLYVKGKWPKKEIDHKRGKSNRFSNLRESSRDQNNQNRKKFKNSNRKEKGVKSIGKNWQASIKVNKTTIHLGTFSSFASAKTARRKAARRYHGQFARY